MTTLRGCGAPTCRRRAFRCAFPSGSFAGLSWRASWASLHLSSLPPCPLGGQMLLEGSSCGRLARGPFESFDELLELGLRGERDLQLARHDACLEPGES